MVGWLATNGELGTFEYSLQPRLGGDIDDLSETLVGNIGRTPHGEMLAAAASGVPSDETFHLKVEVPAYAFGDMGLHYQRGHELLVPILRSYANDHLQTA